MFYYKTKFFEQICYYIVITKKIAVGNMKQFALENEESIINKRNDRDWNFEIF